MLGVCRGQHRPSPLMWLWRVRFAAGLPRPPLCPGLPWPNPFSPQSPGLNLFCFSQQSLLAPSLPPLFLLARGGGGGAGGAAPPSARPGASFGERLGERAGRRGREEGEKGRKEGAGGCCVCLSVPVRVSVSAGPCLSRLPSRGARWPREGGRAAWRQRQREAAAGRAEEEERGKSRAAIVEGNLANKEGSGLPAAPRPPGRPPGPQPPAQWPL